MPEIVSTILQIVLIGIALSMDAFAVSVTQALIYSDLNKKKGLFIALTYAIFQALFPLIGFFVIELISTIVGSTAGEQAGKIMSVVVTYVSFALLIFIGAKMIIEAIISYRKTEEEKEIKKFSIKEVLVMGVATAIDALAIGVTLHSGISSTTTIWLHVSIIMCCTFIICLLGIVLAHQIHKLLKGKYEITGIIGGTILILLAIWVIVSHYTGL